MEISKRIAKRIGDLVERLGLMHSDVASKMKLDINRYNRLRKGDATATDKELRILLTIKEDLEEIDKRLDGYGRRKRYLEK